MLEQVTTRALEQAERRVAARCEKIAARIAIAGVRARVEGETVILEGRALTRRLLSEPGLRWRLREAQDGA